MNINVERLTDPEIRDKQLEIDGGSRLIRKIGGYTLGIMSNGFALGAFSNILITGGLSLPIGLGLATVGTALSRKILRPAYQNDTDYESVKQESKAQRLKRVAVSMGGLALFDLGLSLVGGGIFNALPFGITNGFARIAGVAAGVMGVKYGNNLVRGSFDPLLYSEEPVANADTELQTQFSELDTSTNSTARELYSKLRSRLSPSPVTPADATPQVA